MKKILIFSLLLLQACAWVSCYKDKGNYNYIEINELSFGNIDTVTGYNAVFGNTLNISPKVIGTLDPDGNKRVYKYEWSYDRVNVEDTVVSRSKDLSVLINVPPGNYTLQFRVIDSATGVNYHVRTKLLVSTDVYEGYLVLNEVNGKSRLDMLSFNSTNNSFTQFTDLLQKMNSNLPEQGKPYQVYTMETVYSGSATPASYGIYLLTETGTSRLNPETYAYGSLGDIRYDIRGNVPAGFKAQSFVGEFVNGSSPTNLINANGDVFQRTSNNGFVFNYLPLNAYQGGVGTFKASPYIVTDGFYSTIFDTDKRVFTLLSGNAATSVTEAAPALNYYTGKDLVYMTRTYTDLSYAVLKDPGASNYYLQRFVIGEVATYKEQIMGTEIDQATHFAVSPDLGYLFYSVDGKLYEYDLSLKTSKLMLDKGAEQITYLNFQNFFYRDLKPDTYGKWGKWLSVGSYDPAGTAGANGTLELYSIPPVNAPVVLEKKWTGFGKITSVAYRERQ